MSPHIEKDYLTGFSLRAPFVDYVKKLIIDSKLQKKTFTLILLDLDHFKKFNDKIGHAFGDEILKYVASSLRLSFRKTPSHIFRYGGDEFVVVLPDKDSQEALRLIHSLKHNMSHRPFLFENKLFKITTSCGIATFPHDGQTMGKMIEKADAAMYFSKQCGRNGSTLASQIKFLNFRKKLSRFGLILFIIASLYFAATSVLKPQFQNLIQTVRHTKITTLPQVTDVILLKNGNILRGTITKETSESIIVNMPLKDGSASLTLKRAEIERIKYAPKKTK